MKALHPELVVIPPLALVAVASAHSLKRQEGGYELKTQSPSVPFVSQAT